MKRKTNKVSRAVTRTVELGVGSWVCCNFRDRNVELAHYRNQWTGHTSDWNEASTIRNRLAVHGSHVAAVKSEVACFCD